MCDLHMFSCLTSRQFKKKIHEEFGSQAVQSCGIQLIIANDDNGTIWAAKLKSSNHTNLPSNSGNVISDELNANKATKKKRKKIKCWHVLNFVQLCLIWSLPYSFGGSSSKTHSLWQRRIAACNRHSWDPYNKLAQNPPWGITMVILTHFTQPAFADFPRGPSRWRPCAETAVLRSCFFT